MFGEENIPQSNPVRSILNSREKAGSLTGLGWRHILPLLGDCPENRLP
jgi:hypothetical protein